MERRDRPGCGDFRHGLTKWTTMRSWSRSTLCSGKKNRDRSPGRAARGAKHPCVRVGSSRGQPSGQRYRPAGRHGPGPDLIRFGRICRRCPGSAGSQGGCCDTSRAPLSPRAGVVRGGADLSAMPAKDPAAYLQHIRDCCVQVAKCGEIRRKGEIPESIALDAVCRNLEIIGEAAGNHRARVSSGAPRGSVTSDDLGAEHPDPQL